MATIAPLTPDQIADLYGAINENVGTGDGSNKNFQLDYYPIVNGRIIQDELVGVGDGIQTNYQLQYYPVTSGALKLYRTAVADANLLTETTHYTVTLSTGAIVLTGAGVTYLGTEQLHAAYSVPSTLELHKTSITGPLLTPGTDYTVVAFNGKITLTDAGKYQVTSGLVNILVESNASLLGTLSRNVILLGQFQSKDDDLRYIHETVETKAVLPIEEERRYAYDAYAILNFPPYNFTESGNYVQATEEITETRIADSVSAPYTSTDPLIAPLYKKPTVASEIPGNPGNPRQPDGGSPRFAVGLTGGTGNDTNTLEHWLARELTRIPLVQAAGGDFPGPGGWDDRYVEAQKNFGGLGGMIDSINNELTLLDDGGGNGVIPGLQDFLAYNPVPNEYVTATDISNAQTALTTAQNFYTASYNYLNTDVIPAPHSGLSNANLATRTAAVTAYQTFLLTTRKPQVSDFLALPPAGLYHRRFFWIVMRAAIGSGTLFNIYNTQRGSTEAQAKIATNAARIAEVMAVILAQ